ncbi:MAG TPA: hypothetical protein VIF62_13570 [Labilithrix sp.]
MRRFFLVAALALAGCPDDHADTPATDGGTDGTKPPSTCATGFLGDASMPIQIEVHAIKADGSDVVLKDGDDLAIIFPPQGGRVAFVGIRATNLDGCGVQLTAALRDPISNQVRLDGRTVNLNREADGWGTTGSGISTDIASSDAIAQYSNVPLCPNQWASQDIYDKTFQLEVIVQDSRKQRADVKLNVVPRCAEGGAKMTACLCLCKNGYSGESCGEAIDAGM